MTNDGDPVSVTLTRDEWRAVKRTLHANAFDKTVLLKIRHALAPVSVPDPRAPIVEPKPKGDGWPVLKSAQQADADRV